MINFKHPKNIDLANNPLIEAWLEIKWKLELTDIPDLLSDPNYSFTLGIFYNNIKDKFPNIIELGANKAPVELTPHMVRHRFTPSSENQWPMVQLGPGVAAANFSNPYTRDNFFKHCEFLRNNLIKTYTDFPLSIESISLRYRNFIEFDYSTNDILHFLSTKLNTNVEFPNFIPGNASKNKSPSTGAIKFSFDLDYPEGTGVYSINTGFYKAKTPSEKIGLVTQFEVLSSGDQTPDITNLDEFKDWLSKAHEVLHDWFFDLIDGELLQEMQTLEQQSRK